MDIPIFDFLRKQLGLKTDAADPAGSLHAKVADVRVGVQGIQDKLSTGYVKSVQRGVTTLPSNTSYVDVTISEVDTSKSFVSMNGAKVDLNDGVNIEAAFQTSLAYCRLTSSTNLRVEYGYQYQVSPAGTLTVAWEVVEFY